jgi:colicin import membrane protein
MRTDGNDAGAFLLSLLLHALVAALAWVSSLWIWRTPPAPAAGEPIGATLEISAADLRRAEQAIEQARKANPPPPQPVPEPRPQDAEVPLQTTPQAPLDKPDTVDQEEVVRNAIDPSDATEEQEERRRQEQVDLTEDIERQRKIEELQRMRAERAEAEKVTRMEEMRLAQLRDQALPKPPAARAQPQPKPPQARAGQNGTDDSLLAEYIAAMHATAHGNWNRGLAPERMRCEVRFTQIPGGEVINVEFMDCPYDAQGRESVERALRRTPMPYEKYHAIFIRKVTLTFCYPPEEQVCQSQ